MAFSQISFWSLSNSYVSVAKSSSPILCPQSGPDRPASVSEIDPESTNSIVAQLHEQLARAVFDAYSPCRTTFATMHSSAR